MLLVTVTLDTIQRSLKYAIGPDDCPINYVATLAAFLARLRPHKLDIAPSKTQSYPRESNFWATSSLRMVSVLTTTKSLPCLAFLCLRTSNSSAVYVMVLVTTSRLCLTCPAKIPDYDPAQATIQNVIYALSAELAAPPIFSLPWFGHCVQTFLTTRLLCDASTDGFAAILEQKQPDGSICLMIYIGQSTLRQSAELDSYSIRSGMRCVEYLMSSSLFIQRVRPSLRGPRVASTNKQSR